MDDTETEGSTSKVGTCSFDLRIKGIDNEDGRGDRLPNSTSAAEPINFVTPGKVITREIGFMR